MDHAPRWKASAFTWAMGELILARVADGETMKAITADPRMPSYATVFQWLRAPPAFRAAYRELRDELAAHRRASVDARAFWPAHKAKVDGRGWWRRGRPFSYRRETGEAICARLRRGETMMAINADPAMPSAKVVYTWLRTVPEFRGMVMEARDWWIDWLEFHAENVADLACEDPRALPRIRRAVGKIEGRAGRQRTKVYRLPAKPRR